MNAAPRCAKIGSHRSGANKGMHPLHPLLGGGGGGIASPRRLRYTPCLNSIVLPCLALYVSPSGLGAAHEAPLPPPTQTSSMLARIGGMVGDKSSGNGSSGNDNNQSSGARSTGWRMGVGGKGKTDDAWEIERRERIEKARLMEAQGDPMGESGGASEAMPGGGTTSLAGSELGEMSTASFGGVARRGGGWSQEFGAVSGGAKGMSAHADEEQVRSRRESEVSTV